MVVAIAVSAVVVFAAGVYVGRKYEQAAVDFIITELARVKGELAKLKSKV